MENSKTVIFVCDLPIRFKFRFLSFKFCVFSFSQICVFIQQHLFLMIRKSLFTYQYPLNSFFQLKLHAS